VSGPFVSGAELSARFYADAVRPLLGGADPEAAFAEMEERAREELEDPELRRRADLRYRGQSFELTVEADDLEAVEERFAAAHERRYGYRMEGEPVELVNARLMATQPVERPELSEPEPEGDERAGTRAASFDGEWVEVPVLRRRGMGEGTRVEGPAIVEFPEATCVVRPGWSGAVDGAGTLVLERG